MTTSIIGGAKPNEDQRVTQFLLAQGVIVVLALLVALLAASLKGLMAGILAGLVSWPVLFCTVAKVHGWLLRWKVRA